MPEFELVSAELKVSFIATGSIYVKVIPHCLGYGPQPALSSVDVPIINFSASFNSANYPKLCTIFLLLITLHASVSSPPVSFTFLSFITSLGFEINANSVLYMTYIASLLPSKLFQTLHQNFCPSPTLLPQSRISTLSFSTLLIIYQRTARPFLLMNLLNFKLLDASTCKPIFF